MFGSSPSIVAALSGDMEAAEKVELVLPETGVELSDDEAVYDLGPVAASA